MLRGKRGLMVARVGTVAFHGIEAVPVDVQVMIAPGKMGMSIVGLPDKAVAESRERVQAALHASGLSMPAKRVTVNLAPADLPKEGSHYDLPIAVGLMAAMGPFPPMPFNPILCWANCRLMVPSRRLRAFFLLQ
ncbi:ATP-binding protein [Brucella suis bv. 1]|nr:ATP-binding protein [Brucella suis bv. 1]